MTEVRWHVRESADVAPGLGWLSEPEAARAAAMPIAKRREEFLLGRWTAKHAVALALGLGTDERTLAGIAVLADADGAPYVEIGGAVAPVSVSITHRAGRAVCAVATEPVSLGCDLELVEPRTAAFVADYLTEAEQQFVAAVDGQVSAERANLVWSAKESALKALRTGLRRDTRSVEVTVDEHAPPGAGGWRPLVVRAETQLRGWWLRLDDYVLTVVMATPTSPPVRLPG